MNSELPEKVRPLLQAWNFTVGSEAGRTFKELNNDLCSARLAFIREGVLSKLHNASCNALANVPPQDCRPLAFMSRTLNHYEKRYPAAETEVTAVIEAVRKWKHSIYHRH